MNKDVRGLVEELPVAMPESPLEPQWNPVKSAEPLSSGDFKHCPYCAEAIRAEAIVCRYCSRDMPSAQARPSTDLDQHERNQLQSLLAPGSVQTPDRSLLDIFEYGRLLEAEEGAGVLTLVGGSTPGPAPEARGEEHAPARLSFQADEWEDEPTDQARVASRR